METVLPAGISANQASDPLRFVLRLNQVLAADTTPHHFMKDVLAALHEVPEVTASWISRPDPNGTLLPCVWCGQGAPTAAQGAPPPEAPCSRAFKANEAIYIDDWQNIDLSGRMDRRNWRGGVAVPLVTAPGAVNTIPPSILVIQTDQPAFFRQVWSPEIVTHIAAVIGRALQIRHTQEALKRSQALHQTLFNGADLLVTAHSESNLLKQVSALLVGSGLFICANIEEMIGGAKAWRKRSASATFDIDAFLRAAERLDADERFPRIKALAWQGNKTVVSNHYSDDPRFPALNELGHKFGIGSSAAMLIVRNHRPWAVLVVAAAEPEFFDAEIIHLLERMAAMVGHILGKLDTKASLRAERDDQRKIARSDPLTQLPNGLALTERLTAAIARAKRDKTTLAVAKIDFDNFKKINHQWGRPAGDNVLCQLATRIRDAIPAADFTARLGTDEFVFVLEDPQSTNDIPGLFNRLATLLASPVTLPDGQTVQIGHSAGVTLYPHSRTTPAQLLRHAEIALFAAKSAKDTSHITWRLYKGTAKGANPTDFGRALLAAGALRVLYQPIKNLATGAITCVEALARLEESGRLISPAAFLPGLLQEDRHKLFQQVLITSLNQLRAWDNQNLTLSASVNIDAQILLQERTLPFIRDSLNATGIPPHRLALELLETHDVIDLAKARRQMETVRATGIRLALDDLGAGYSSILKVRELPLDIVKLDRAFVAGLRDQPDNLMFVSALQTLTASRNMTLVVEGVTSDDMLDALSVMGVPYAQGYFIARPMDAAKLTAWLHAQTPETGAQRPHSLIGAYAVHLGWQRVFNGTHTHKSLMQFLSSANIFSLEHFFESRNLADTPLHTSYQALHAIIQSNPADHTIIANAVAIVRQNFIAALKNSPPL